MRTPLHLFALLALLVAALTPFGTTAHAQRLRVLDPQQPWKQAQGTIEEAILTVEPKGVYLEYGLYLTFSARAGSFASTDTLEVELFFDLPEESVVIDSWLWFKGEILRADLLDVWTASDIYEDIVRRRQDPSILYKRSATDYELRIFPMAATETRQVKLTYLVPADWTAERARAGLPTELLRTSAFPVDLQVRVADDADWQAPAVPELPNLTFTRSGDTWLDATLPWQALTGPLSVAFSAPLTNGVFVSRTSFADEDWYQVAVVPSESAPAEAGRKVALLLDYDAFRTSVDEAALLRAVRAEALATLAPADSFAVFYTRLSVQQATDGWQPADTATIRRTFDALGDTPLADFSNLAQLLDAALGFVEATGGEGQLLLVGSSEQAGDVTAANELLDELRSRYGTLPPISIVDLVNQNFNWHPVGNRSYQANEYFYANLARLSGGTYVHLRSGDPFGQLVARGFEALGGVVNAFDLYTSLSGGFCYGRFDDAETGRTVLADRGLWQVSKCFGEPPFVVEASGFLRGKPFSQRIQVTEDLIRETDSTLAAFWSGQQIAALEQERPTNEIVNQIVDASLAARVLSRYTAFIALEPNQGGEVCDLCEDESDNPTDVEDETPRPEEATLEAYPNPFAQSVTVTVQLPAPVDAADVQVHVYNAMGQRIRTLRLDGSGFGDQFELLWDGTNDAGQPVASGVYFVVVTTPTGRHTIALTVVR